MSEKVYHTTDGTNDIAVRARNQREAAAMMHVSVYYLRQHGGEWPRDFDHQLPEGHGPFYRPINGWRKYPWSERKWYLRHTEDEYRSSFYVQATT